jgi:hypothetical protein
VHIHPTNFDAIDVTFSKADKAASVRRAADIRRKLMKCGFDVEPFESLMINPVQEGGSRQRRGQNHANNPERLQSAGKAQVDQLLSFWV